MNYVIAVSVDYNSISIHNYNDLLCSPFAVLPVARVLLLRSELKILVSSRLRLQVILGHLARFRIFFHFREFASIRLTLSNPGLSLPLEAWKDCQPHKSHTSLADPHCSYMYVSPVHFDRSVSRKPWPPSL